MKVQITFLEGTAGEHARVTQNGVEGATEVSETNTTMVLDLDGGAIFHVTGGGLPSEREREGLDDEVKGE